MRDILAEVRDLKSEARRRREAEPPNYAGAGRSLRKAIDLLESALEEMAEEGTSRLRFDFAQQLADCYGSMGGVLRSDKKYEESISHYDRGNEIERRYKMLSSYNLVQRLVARILSEPGKVEAREWRVQGVDVAAELVAAEAVLESQQSARAGDVWFLADQALLALLLRRDSEGAAWRKFKAAKPPSFAYDSILRVIDDLTDRLAGVSFPEGGRCFVDIQDRLSAAQSRLIQARTTPR